MKLSLILPTYDRQDITKIHFREVMNSTRLPDEVIVVNDGGDTNLKEILKEIPMKTKVIYARVNENIEWNYNGACNLGVWLSTGDLLMFEDNDNIPQKNYYELAEKTFIDTPDLGRAVSKVRNCISEEDILNKPSEEWKTINTIGPNQGTAIIKRELYLKLKGLDERFCGRYGWMYYDWRKRMMRIGVNFGTIDGAYFYCDKVQTGLSHKPHPANYGILRRNTKGNVIQSPNGILNFTYEYERLC